MKAKRRKSSWAAKKLFDAIFEQNDGVLIRPIETWDDGDRKQSRTIYDATGHALASEIDSIFNDLIDTSEHESANLFFGVCPRFECEEGFDQAWQIRIVRTVWADIDGCTFKDALARIEKANLPPPTALINSGNGVHVYWVLAEPFLIDDVGDPPPVEKEWIEIKGKKRPIHFYEDPESEERIYLNDSKTGRSLPHNRPKLSPKAEQIQGILGCIAEKIGGDHTKDLSRLLRLPGTWNRKDERNGQKPVRCTLIESHPDRRYDLSEFPDAPTEKPERIPNESVKKHNRHGSRFQQFLELVNESASVVVGHRSEKDFHLCCFAIQSGFPKQKVWEFVKEIGKFRGDGEVYFDRTWSKAKEEVWNDAGTESLSDPHRLAKSFLLRRPFLISWREEFYDFDGSSYKKISKGDLEAELTSFAKEQFDYAARKADSEAKDNNTKTIPPVTRSLIGNVKQALHSLCLLSSQLESPLWIGNEDWFPASECIVTKSAIVHLLTGETMELTARFFALSAVGYEYDSDAVSPRWLNFLSELWLDDQGSLDTLQEIIGYLLLSDTSQQKIFLMIGPKRSGKGTIARVIQGLVGRENVAAPTLKSLQGDFGLQPLLEKTVAIIGDARLSGRSDVSAIAETLLSISGEDARTVNRKNLPMVTTQLKIRFLIISNELPRLDDASATIVSRLIVMQIKESFFGRENPNLFEELITELPGILNWAIEGLQRLLERGHFEQPHSSEDLIQEMEELSSPVLAFVNEECEVGVEYSIPKGDMYLAFHNWCNARGMHPISQGIFGRNLKAAIPSISDSQPRIKGKQVRVYVGIKLKRKKKRILRKPQ